MGRARTAMLWLAMFPLALVATFAVLATIGIATGATGVEVVVWVLLSLVVAVVFIVARVPRRLDEKLSGRSESKA